MQQFNQGVDIFKPGIAELKSLAEKYRTLKINGLEDSEGYIAVKEARKELGQWRIGIQKHGKKCREEAILYQREVLRQEKEHLAVIVPVEDSMKTMLAEVDDAKRREERKALLPSRRRMLDEIKQKDITDEQILDMDEKQFSDFYFAKKVEFDEEKERAQQAKEEAKRAKAEAEAAKAAAVEQARKEEREKAEKEKQEAIDKVKREQEAKDRAAKEAADAEKAEQKKLARRKTYREWLEQNGVDPKNNDGTHLIKRDGDKFILYIKKSEIVIQ